MNTTPDWYDLLIVHSCDTERFSVNLQTITIGQILFIEGQRALNYVEFNQKRLQNKNGMYHVRSEAAEYQLSKIISITKQNTPASL